MAKSSHEWSSQDRKLSPMVNLHAVVFAILTGSRLGKEHSPPYNCRLDETAATTRRCCKVRVHPFDLHLKTCRLFGMIIQSSKHEHACWVKWPGFQPFQR